MEKRKDLRSILPYLPLLIRSSTLFWPSQIVEAFKELSRGPLHSHVDSGQLFFLAISDLRNSFSSSFPLSPSVSHGYELFFDELMSREESRKWFEEVIPALGKLLLRLPSLLEAHYGNADMVIGGGGNTVITGLCFLDSQQEGAVFLSQELIAALLGCSLFCLFPDSDRHVKNLPTINFDELFACLYDDYNQKQENKIWCIIHYFQRISHDMPKGIVSFERKVLPFEGDPVHISYPNANFWSTSVIPLCKFEVHCSGLMEDQSSEAVEVDFANKYLGGGALHRGCVQEEIRFMVSPELIAGMLFLPSMADNEAIEIVGVERFSSYTGYASSFRFSGDYVDKKDIDIHGRRKTRIVAIDALCSPGTRQYRESFILREINKAFCGFLDQSTHQWHHKMFYENVCSSALFSAAASTSMETSEENISNHIMEQGNNIGIATGNWGCGAFGGDPEMKTIIQWLAASQALRPFMAYYTFGLGALHNLHQVSDWILSEKWTVGELWNMLIEYSKLRSKGETNVGFFKWLLPSVYNHGHVGMDLS
ncbi:PREDICTED: poly(ADP-ribose) glycohydrolase 1 isoform X1 [Lupinus angustifolius]|uniref:poly(ADP-ribose) glycohydrolase 1 isoform X1 n=1 Tax=Lupinus angustifolius TaxID=3871 RepID=UPI00092E9791|nr:PREDICTED: poly(ADP-ribose) glycohydrolase 1 isoform X1 [Lupinus angustifolius]XP_019422279.1 PREDICTED: poly(ADP-ribose) glycohydrolase 1 isoform X1 [Lupinus angustifolius]